MAKRQGARPLYRLTIALLIVAALTSLAANLFEHGGAALHPRHGVRLAEAAARDGVLVQAYTRAGRALLPTLGLDFHAQATAQTIYGAAFQVLDGQPAVGDERSFTDMLRVAGVYRPAWRVANVWGTPVLFGLLLVAWFSRPRAIRTFPHKR